MTAKSAWQIAGRLLIWTGIWLLGALVFFFATQFGDPATEAAHQFQIWASRVFLIAAPLIWLTGSVWVVRRAVR